MEPTIMRNPEPRVELHMGLSAAKRLVQLIEDGDPELQQWPGETEHCLLLNELHRLIMTAEQDAILKVVGA